MRQNRNGKTITEKYKGYEVTTRMFVRNDSDKTFSVIVTEPIGSNAYLIKKRYSGLSTLEQGAEAVEKAKKLIDTLVEEEE